MNKQVKRHTWEDSLIQAQADGMLTDRALLVGLKLAKAINWAPKAPQRKGKPGLYWKNSEACEHVGIARATFHRANRELKEAGYFALLGGNLMVQLPTQSPTESGDPLD